jgi:hypothetical protein
VSQPEGFDADRFLSDMAANGLAELRRVGPDHQAATLRTFVALVNGATRALVAAGVLSAEVAGSVEQRVLAPLLDAGGAERVEVSIEAGATVGIGRRAAGPGRTNGPAADPPALRRVIPVNQRLAGGEKGTTRVVASLEDWQDHLSVRWVEFSSEASRAGMARLTCADDLGTEYGAVGTSTAGGIRHLNVETRFQPPLSEGARQVRIGWPDGELVNAVIPHA